MLKSIKRFTSSFESLAKRAASYQEQLSFAEVFQIILN